MAIYSRQNAIFLPGTSRDLWTGGGRTFRDPYAFTTISLTCEMALKRRIVDERNLAEARKFNGLAEHRSCDVTVTSPFYL